jgi:hypothetical protein
MPAFLTREFFDTLIIVIVIIGTALAAVSVYRDLTRPLPRIPAENLMPPDNLIPPTPFSDISGEDPTPTSGSR